MTLGSLGLRTVLEGYAPGAAWPFGLRPQAVDGTQRFCIHHFGIITQNTVEGTESKAYPAQNLAHFRHKWGRTVRGNWLQRWWTDLRERWIERYERFWYGHTLLERG